LLARSGPLSNWTCLSCQRIKLVGERCASKAFNPKLVLSDHVHELDAGEYVGRCIKGLKAQHKLGHALDRAVVLLNYIVEVCRPMELVAPAPYHADVHS
jgi:hypothetical protein